MNWRSKRTVLLLVAAVCAALFAAGLVVGWRGRNAQICKDGRPPVSTAAGILNQVQYKCHDGRTVTLS